MIIDVHCHYTLTAQRPRAAERFSFEQPESGDLPTAYDSCVSPRARRRVLLRLIQMTMGATGDDAAVDRRLEKFYQHHLGGCSEVDAWVLLAFDAYHDDDGRRTPLPRRRRDPGVDIYSSNSFIRDLCQQRRGRHLFGASVHPYRQEALDALDEVLAGGACLVKLMPLHQNINPTDPRTIRYFRKCAAIGLPLLLHYGGEGTLRTNHPQYAELSVLLDVLRQLRRDDAMPTTIIAHAATPITPLGPWRHHRALTDALLGDLADAPLYADVSAVLSFGKVLMLRRMARRQELHHKLLFGSDFPVAPAGPWLRWRLGAGWPRNGSWSHRSVSALRHVGFNEIVFHRAAQILPSTDYFAAK